MKTIYLTTIMVLLLFTTCRPTRELANRDAVTGANFLVNESSPYLLQHAYNPVNWYPWGEAALKRAEAEDKMILISVGYSACHWCNVMERESFMDSTIAKIINEHFIAIKVDREERPDIDDVYMTACEVSLGKNCGWPLNAFALPDGSPFWAGTYFQKEQWAKILTYMVEERAKNRTKVDAWANDIIQGISTLEQIPVAEKQTVFSTRHLDNFANSFLKNIDFEKGGKDVKVKFPLPNNYQFLIKAYSLTGNQKLLEAVEVTLENMAYGGIYDHIGGGFSRYSTDEQWKVPHFEKMLYDNSQLVSLYSEAYRLTKKPIYKERVYETLEFIKNEMTSIDGGFYSSYDADSDGEEGKYYVWTLEEIDAAIQNDEAETLFKDFYNITKEGNWEKGKNILYAKHTPSFVANKYGLKLDEFEAKITEAKRDLKNARAGKTKPNLDNKILTAWNALMLKGYVDAYRTFGEKQFLDAALANGRFLMKNVIKKDARLTRNYKDGNTVVNGFLDDYALTADAFIALYQVTFDEQWLYKAKDLTEYALNHFFDMEANSFYYTSDLDPPLVTRKREVVDNVMPSSNSMMAKVLHHLGIYLFNEEYETTAREMTNNMLATMTAAQQPNFYSNWGIVLADFIYEPFEVAIVGDNFNAVRQELDETYIPNMLLLGGAQEGTIELLEGKLVKGETTIYVCKNKVCKFPVSTVTEALELMKE
jgi:uncharacterized protein